MDRRTEQRLAQIHRDQLARAREIRELAADMVRGLRYWKYSEARERLTTLRRKAQTLERRMPGLSYKELKELDDEGRPNE